MHGSVEKNNGYQLYPKSLRSISYLNLLKIYSERAESMSRPFWILLYTCHCKIWLHLDWSYLRRHLWFQHVQNQGLWNECYLTDYTLNLNAMSLLTVDIATACFKCVSVLIATNFHVDISIFLGIVVFRFFHRVFVTQVWNCIII